jgi:thiamine pyrophosphate-dependent acetolactate synthase large subunit-like protein
MSSDGGRPPRENDEGRADQYDCTERLLSATPDALVVSNLGVASYVLAGVADRPRNFYLWGSMGVTTPVGLGLAMARDEQVTVLDGDGSTLMSMGVFATLSTYDPSNLTVVVWNNDGYATTGGQPSNADAVDFAAVAEDCGLYAARAASGETFQRAYEDAVAHDGAAVVVCDVARVDPEERPPFDFAHLKRRFRDEVVERSDA